MLRPTCKTILHCHNWGYRLKIKILRKVVKSGIFNNNYLNKNWISYNISYHSWMDSAGLTLKLYLKMRHCQKNELVRLLTFLLYFGDNTSILNIWLSQIRNTNHTDYNSFQKMLVDCLILKISIFKNCTESCVNNKHVLCHCISCVYQLISLKWRHLSKILVRSIEDWSIVNALHLKLFKFSDF